MKKRGIDEVFIKKEEEEDIEETPKKSIQGGLQ